MQIHQQLVRLSPLDVKISTFIKNCERDDMPNLAEHIRDVLLTCSEGMCKVRMSTNINKIIWKGKDTIPKLSQDE